MLFSFILFALFFDNTWISDFFYTRFIFLNIIFIDILVANKSIIISI
ncbi:hypothetical protein AX13_17100 [Comamonas aquatica DA1877]|uniref:Uncharacterized protein n=1 Tax=Comamonas aquatica DA1877 TaxID=1457173 RepID=A0A014MF85_9BURK|nr:hypothetical protein AX13_17100 [Comamonas aquatica DA1877]